MTFFDLVVIGSGPGGYVSAIRASQLGLNTAIVEKDQLGGVCLNWGCIPTKALLRSAEIKHLIDHADAYGLTVQNCQIHVDKIVKRSREVAQQLAGGIQHLLKKNKVTVFKGEAFLKNPSTLEIRTSQGDLNTITAKHIIIATGAKARTLPSISLGPRVWTAKEAMVPDFLPKSLIIVGSGAIGIEFASFYSTLGCKVTVIEIQSHILSQEDKEISSLALKAFEKKGIKFFLDSIVDHVETSERSVKVTINRKDEKIPQEADAMIIAVGVIGNTEGLGLEKTKVKVEKNQIQVNEWGETTEPGIYAIGDVAGAPWLAHKASHQGIICVEKIADLKDVHPMKIENIPGCIYSLPQIASIGLTESAAKEEGYNIKIGRFPFKGNGKAIALGETDGLVKTIFDVETGALLGAHMIGAEVTELIQGFAIAKTLETTEAELIQTIFPHPTLSEMMHESSLDAYGKAIHF